jgi:hypothetical protein
MSKPRETLGYTWDLSQFHTTLLPRVPRGLSKLELFSFVRDLSSTQKTQIDCNAETQSNFIDSRAYCCLRLCVELTLINYSKPDYGPMIWKNQMIRMIRDHQATPSAMTRLKDFRLCSSPFLLRSPAPAAPSFRLTRNTKYVRVGSA